MSKKATEKFLKERYEKDDQYFTVYEHYTPNYFRETIAGKFYSQHDTLDLTQADMEVVDAIKRAKDKLPRNKFPWPVTESHNYGWYEPLVALDRNDNRLYFPTKVAPFVIHEILLRLDKTMEKPKFVGVPFKL